MRIVGIIAGVGNILLALAIAFLNWEPTQFSLIVTYGALGFMFLIAD